MYLVLSNWMGEPHASKETHDPQSSISYKTRKQNIIAIVSLTERGDELPLDVLKELFLEGLFDRPSRYRQADAPAKQIAGAVK